MRNLLALSCSAKSDRRNRGRSMMRSHLKLVALVAATMVLSVGCGKGAPDSEQHAEAATAAFCAEHQIAEAQCPYCDPSLIESVAELITLVNQIAGLPAGQVVLPIGDMTLFDSSFSSTQSA